MHKPNDTEDKVKTKKTTRKNLFVDLTGVGSVKFCYFFLHLSHFLLQTTVLGPKLLCLLAVSLSLRFGLFQLSTERLDVRKIALQLGAQPVDLEVDLTGVGSVRLRYLVQLSKE